MIQVDEQLVVSVVRGEIADLEAVYLFGSAAAGDGGPGSDVDVALLPTSPIADARLRRVREELETRLRRDVHLVDLRCATTVFRVQVVANGRVLYERDAASRERFEDYVFASYARLNESRRAIVEDARAEGRIHAR